jgi:ATP-binding cassette, subfamily C (CFTR/MRP), member 1
MSMLCINPEGLGPWSPRPFDFTACFEELVMESFPRLILLVFGVATCFHIQFQSRFVVPKGWKYYSKIVISISLMLITACSFVTKMQFLGLLLNIFVFGFAAILHHLEHYYSKVSYSFLLIFWLLECIVTGLQVRTMLETHGDVKTLIYLFSKSVLVILIFVLECSPKELGLYVGLDEQEHISPEASSNIFSRLTFHWMTPLMKQGYKKVLDMDDLWYLKPADQTVYNNEHFERNLRIELSKTKPSLTRALFFTYWKTLFSCMVFKFCQDVLQFTQPQLLHLMMVFAATYAAEWAGMPMPMYKGILIAFGMLFTAISQTMFLHQYFHGCFMMGMRVRSSIIQAIYKKSLRLSNSARQGSTIGEITNLMSVDASKLADLCTYLNILWSGPMQICIAVYFLYQTLGVAVFGGIAVMVLMIPVNGWIAKKSRDLNKIQMGNKDTRTKMMDEVLSGMKVIKLYAWEGPFIQSILAVREKELYTLKRMAYLQALSSFTWSCTPFLVSFTTFALYSWISPEPLTSTKGIFNLYSLCFSFTI